MEEFAQIKIEEGKGRDLIDIWKEEVVRTSLQEVVDGKLEVDQLDLSE